MVGTKELNGKGGNERKYIPEFEKKKKKEMDASRHV